MNWVQAVPPGVTIILLEGGVRSKVEGHVMDSHPHKPRSGSECPLSAGGLELCTYVPLTTSLGTVSNLAGDRVEALGGGPLPCSLALLLATSHTYERQKHTYAFTIPCLRRNTLQSKDGRSGLGGIFNPRGTRDISCVKLLTQPFSSSTLIPVCRSYITVN